MNISLLHRLRAAGGAFVPLDVLGAGGSREDVLHDLDELVVFGFGIERHPYQGAAYLGPAPRLCPDQIEHELATRTIGRRIAVWNRVTSTNDLAANAAVSTANEGLVVLAEEQSAGRGRRGRIWTAPPRSSLLMSVLLFPEGPLNEPAWLTALGAVALADVLVSQCGLDPVIKWPNDVKIDGRKVAGILVERGEGSVIGLGVNVNLADSDFSDDLRSTATSLRILLGKPLDRSELARSLIQRLDLLYERSRHEGPGTVNRSWRERSEHLGRRVTVSTPSGAIGGRLVDIDLVDGLVLATSEVQQQRVPASQVLTITAADDPPFLVTDGGGTARD